MAIRPACPVTSENWSDAGSGRWLPGLTAVTEVLSDWLSIVPSPVRTLMARLLREHYRRQKFRCVILRGFP